MNSGLAMRLAVWIALLALVVAGRWLWSQREAWLGQPATAASAEVTAHASGVYLRPASVEEWQLDIATLGRQAKGKRLVWQPLNASAWDYLPKGHLVWWHDGQAERLGYAPAAEENAQAAVVDIVRALLEGRAVLYNTHGDAELLQRIGDQMSANWRLPNGLVILSPPPPS